VKSESHLGSRLKVQIPNFTHPQQITFSYAVSANDYGLSEQMRAEYSNVICEQD